MLKKWFSILPLDVLKASLERYDGVTLRVNPALQDASTPFSLEREFLRKKYIYVITRNVVTKQSRQMRLPRDLRSLAMTLWYSF
jgi:hypothetical protein